MSIFVEFLKKKKNTKIWHKNCWQAGRVIIKATKFLWGLLCVVFAGYTILTVHIVKLVLCANFQRKPQIEQK